MILMRVGLASAGFLVERLVVPQPKGAHTEEVTGHPSDALVEGEASNFWMVFPQVHALDERLLVAAALLEGYDVGVAASGGDRCGDRRFVRIQLARAEEIGDDDIPVSPEG